MLSTSTSTNLLSHLTFFLTRNSTPLMRDVIGGMQGMSNRYMISTRKPVTVLLKQVRPGVFAINNDAYTRQKETILLQQGKIIENMLTHPPSQFRSLFLEDRQGVLEDFHRYALINDEVMIRSQIDCVRADDPSCYFEIKSRAVAPIRYDLTNWADYGDYELRQLRGEYESYQREYADLIRGSFLKFCYQMMIGDMDGAFVAYHNTARFFGCQYIPLSEFVKRLFETPFYAHFMLTLTCRVLRVILDKVLATLGR